LRFFVLSGLFVSWHVFGESVLYGVGKPNKPFYVRLAAGAINLVLNIILIKHFGIWGAVWTSIVSLAILAGGVTYFSRREINFTLAGILKRRHDLIRFLRNIRKNKGKASLP
jgi:O-antigen/teichoic acid export membrane protein